MEDVWSYRQVTGTSKPRGYQWCVDHICSCWCCLELSSDFLGCSLYSSTKELYLVRDSVCSYPSFGACLLAGPLSMLNPFPWPLQVKWGVLTIGQSEKSQVLEPSDVPLCLVDRDCIELEGNISIDKKLETWAWHMWVGVTVLRSHDVGWTSGMWEELMGRTMIETTQGRSSRVDIRTHMELRCPRVWCKGGWHDGCSQTSSKPVPINQRFMNSLFSLILSVPLLWGRKSEKVQHHPLWYVFVSIHSGRQDTRHSGQVKRR